MVAGHEECNPWVITDIPCADEDCEEKTTVVPKSEPKEKMMYSLIGYELLSFAVTPWCCHVIQTKAAQNLKMVDLLHLI